MGNLNTCYNVYIKGAFSPKKYEISLLFVLFYMVLSNQFWSFSFPVLSLLLTSSFSVGSNVIYMLMVLNYMLCLYLQHL